MGEWVSGGVVRGKNTSGMVLYDIILDELKHLVAEVAVEVVEEVEMKRQC